MIVYDPFWKTLKKSSKTTYTLIKDHHISSSTIDKLRKNKPITTTTLNDLCRILGWTRYWNMSPRRMTNAFESGQSEAAFL